MQDKQANLKVDQKVDQAFAEYRKTGNPRFLEAVFDCTAAELLRLAKHLCPDINDAEDAVQATFLVAINRRGEYEAKGTVFNWLFGILTRVAQMHRRKEGRKLNPELLKEKVQQDPSEILQGEELSQAVSDAIAKMGEPYRAVLRLHLGHGLMAGDIGIALNRSPGTVRSQIGRGLKLLRQALPASLVAGSIALTTPVQGLAAMREVVLQKASGVAAQAASTSSTLALGKLGLWTAAGTLAAAAMTMVVLAPDQELKISDVSPMAAAQAAAQRNSVRPPATAASALQAGPFSSSSHLLMAISSPQAPGGVNPMRTNNNSPISTHNLAIPTLLLGAMALLPTMGQGQSVIYFPEGENRIDHMGGSVSGAGDVNADGIPDIVAGAAFYDPDPDGTPAAGDELPQAGRVYVVSGIDGTTLHTIDGVVAGDNLGGGVSSAGDVNVDGYADIVAGAKGFDLDPDGTPGTGDETNNVGRVYVYSGKDGSTIYTFDGEKANDNLGAVVGGGGDVNFDGTGDIVAGLRNYDLDPDGTPGTGDETNNLGFS